MQKIILHWTAGGAVPNCCDKNFYHYLVDSFGKIYQGNFKPEDNLNCKSGKYAAHTGGGNTGSIGIAMCGMLNFKDKNHIGLFPLTKIQFESTMQLCAKLAKKYNIKVTPETIFTHYEFGQKHPQTTSAGKIDIVYLPPYSWVSKNEIGGFIRTKIKWYLNKLN